MFTATRASLLAVFAAHATLLAFALKLRVSGALHSQDARIAGALLCVHLLGLPMLISTWECLLCYAPGILAWECLSNYKEGYSKDVPLSC